MENFNLKKFLVENKLTTNSKLLKEETQVDLEQAFIKAGISWSEEVAVVYASQSGNGATELFYIRPDDLLTDLEASIEENGDVIVASDTDKVDSLGWGEDQLEGFTYRLEVEIVNDGLYEIWQDDYPTNAKAHPDFFSSDPTINPSVNEKKVK